MFLIDLFLRTLFWKAALMDAVAAFADSVLALVAEYIDGVALDVRECEFVVKEGESRLVVDGDGTREGERRCSLLVQE